MWVKKPKQKPKPYKAQVPKHGPDKPSTKPSFWERGDVMKNLGSGLVDLALGRGVYKVSPKP